MTTSIPELAPRGMDFLYSRNRLNVATSRARCVAVVVASPDLLRVRARTPEQMRLANAFCRFAELAAARPTTRSPDRPCAGRMTRARRCTIATRSTSPRQPPRRDAPAADGRVARRRRRPGQHRAHRGGHRRDDRRQGHRGLERVLSGAPGAAVVLGAAVGAALLSRLMVRARPPGRAGRRATRIGVVGRAHRDGGDRRRARFPLLLVGTVLIGFGNASNQLSRYAAADLVPGRPPRVGDRHRRLGRHVRRGRRAEPRRLRPATLGQSLGLPELAGAYLVPVVFVGAAAILSFVLLRPDPYALADAIVTTRSRRDATATAASLGQRPRAGRTSRSRSSSLVTVQVVMVLIMTMTPLHMTDHGHDLAAVGIVISGHTFGMYGLSPLSGRLTDRFGSVPVILAGLGGDRARGGAGRRRPAEGGVLLFVALFLLGYGWNLGYVAGSALLTHGPVAGRADPGPGPDRRA